MERFIAIYDTHIGNEHRGSGRGLSPLHDARAIRAVTKFAEDFKPHHLVLGGDILDCGAVSHHNKGKARKIEGMRLQADSRLARELVIEPLVGSLTRPHRGESRKLWIPGNHEDWIEDLIDREPALEGLVTIEKLLGLGRGWELTEYGRSAALTSKLHFIHGDQIRGGENAAKTAVVQYGLSGCIRFGHYHTAQTFTKTSPVEDELPVDGKSVPCLCTKDPKYNEGAPNKWAQGFLFGYINGDGTFNDYVAIIINGKFIANGKEFRG